MHWGFVPDACLLLVGRLGVDLFSVFSSAEKLRLGHLTSVGCEGGDKAQLVLSSVPSTP